MLGPAYDINEEGNRKRAASDDEALVPVHIFDRRVKYKLPYAVLAFIVLILVLATLGFGLVALVFRGATPRRILTAMLLPEDSVKGDAPTEKWLDRKGRVLIDISGRTPRVDDSLAVVDDGESAEGKSVAPGKGADSASRMLERGTAKGNGGDDAA